MRFVFLFRFSLIFVCLRYLVLVIFSWYCCNFLLQGVLIMISNFSPRRFVKLSDMGIFKWKHLATLLWSASSSSVNNLKKVSENLIGNYFIIHISCCWWKKKYRAIPRAHPQEKHKNIHSHEAYPIYKLFHA